MFNRFWAVWLVLGGIAGYAIAGKPVVAQGAGGPPRPPFVNAGHNITLQFEQGSSNVEFLRCAVADVQGIWVRCSSDRFTADRDQQWYSFARVIRITMHER